MEFPQVEGYDIRREIGRGAAGVVYEALAEDGSHRAIKVFDSVSSNVPLLARQLRRVMDGRAEKVTVEIIAEALESRPGLVVMPFYGAEGPGSRPRNLQMEAGARIDWSFLGQLATALSVLHRARVAHGNLKPGNVFLGEKGEPLLADYASGLMPGVHHYQYSDAVLYAPPEQLRDPGGYLEEAGYRWDVYAFGVMAFRFLYGSFPRANDFFEPVSPVPGTPGDSGIEADYEGIAQALETSGPVAWPEENGDEAGKRRRTILASCLNLDPLERPVDMMEVARLLEEIEHKLTTEREFSELEARRADAERQRRRAKRLLVVVLLLAAGMAAGWGGTEVLRREEARYAAAQFVDYQTHRESEVLLLDREVREAKGKEDEALSAERAARQALGLAREKTQAELGSVRRVNDRLLDWILAEGGGDLPVLEDRGARLGFLLEEIDRQLAGLKDWPSLAKQEAVLRLRGAEVALVMGNLEAGEKRLKDAVAAGGFPADQAVRVRLRLLLLASQKEAATLESRLVENENTILAALADDAPRLLRAKAVVSLVRARMWEARGVGDKALAAYSASLEDFRTLGELFPGNATVMMGIGRRALATARVAEAEGADEEGGRLRMEAAQAFTRLAASLKKPSPEIDYQIASARAAQAIAQWQRGEIFEAEELARVTLSELTKLQAKMPKDFRVTVDRVSQQGILATAMRDGGEVEEALRLLHEGSALLEEGLEEEPTNGRARYLLASLKWQLSGILGQQGQEQAGLSMGQEARKGLEALLAEGLKRPHPTEVRKSLAYLCGDLGNAAERSGQSEIARSHFQACQRYWEELSGQDPDDQEVQAGLRWASERLVGLGK